MPSPDAPTAPDAPAVTTAPPVVPPWRRWPARSVKLRLVLLFLALAAALALVFTLAAQQALRVGWREAAQPLLEDYVDRITAEIAPPFSPGGPNAGPTGPPSIERARAVTQRLPVTVRIEGPVVHWSSHPPADGWHRGRDEIDARWPALLTRETADGHRIIYGIDEAVFERRQRPFIWAMGALLLVTLGAYVAVRRLLRPLDAIGAGVRRFGRGAFDAPIPVRHASRPDELDQLAQTVNAMASDIEQMLEAKRGLLLAISHELRSPLTRARLNLALLPETDEDRPSREALQRDLQEMSTLVADLLESERLAGPHAVLHREAVDLRALADEAVEDLRARHASAERVVVRFDARLPPTWSLDRARMRLLLRNLLDNALRHGQDAPCAPEVDLGMGSDGGLTIVVRDHGPGVPEAHLSRLAQPFYRPDSARTRSTGGVGLGLHLCRLVAQAHGGSLTFRSAQPGLAVRVALPGPANPTPG